MQAQIDSDYITGQTILDVIMNLIEPLEYMKISLKRMRLTPRHILE